MSNTKKVWIGISTFAPLLAMFIMFISYFSLFASFANNSQEPNFGLAMGSFFGFGLAYLIILAAAIINVIVYIGHMVRNEKLDPGSKTLWICLTFFFNFIVMIIYYFVYIINDNPPKDVNAPYKIIPDEK